MDCKEYQDKWEREYLSPYAALSSESRGRVREEGPCPIRTDYQRDRDRILHCNAFRRLKHKTQVFLAPQGDHYRTRLTHTLEVSQIARTIARALHLNEDLTEAIAMGHDLGHTPFGHAGERALNAVCPFHFRHYLQSVRVAEKLEKDDKIAYVNHDIEDAIRAEVLSEADLPWEAVYVLGRGKSARLSTVISSIIACSGSDITLDPRIRDAQLLLERFMFENVYTNPVAKGQEAKAEALVQRLYEYYLADSDRLPAFYQGLLEQYPKERVICDYIAGMTDQYAVGLYEELFIPRFWTKE